MEKKTGTPVALENGKRTWKLGDLELRVYRV